MLQLMSIIMLASVVLVSCKKTMMKIQNQPQPR